MSQFLPLLEDATLAAMGKKELMHFLDKRRKGANLLEDLDFRLCLSSTVGIVSPSIDERL